MGKIKHDKSMIVLSFARNANAIASSSGSDIRVIHTHSHNSVVYTEQTLCLSSVLVDEVDISVCRVIYLYHC